MDREQVAGHRDCTNSVENKNEIYIKRKSQLEMMITVELHLVTLAVSF